MACTNSDNLSRKDFARYVARLRRHDDKTRENEMGNMTEVNDAGNNGAPDCAVNGHCQAADTIDGKSSMCSFLDVGRGLYDI